MSAPTREQVIQWAISSGTICGSRELVLGATERLERLAALAYSAGQAESQEVRLVAEKQRDELLALIKNDAFAMSFQSMGQYRTALIASVKGGVA